MNDRSLQLGVFVAALIGYVALAFRDLETAGYVALVGPVLGAVILKSHLGQQDQKLEHQDKVLTEIHDNTNGKLDRRIENAVERALTRAQQGESAE